MNDKPTTWQDWQFPAELLMAEFFPGPISWDELDFVCSTMRDI